MNHYKKADFLSSCDGREEPPSDQAITDDNQGSNSLYTVFDQLFESDNNVSS